jgi:glycerophosphoryl diester phosphodiesterase
MPENTLSSFSYAIECGVDMVELDVWKCASGELIVFHDAKVDRLTDGTGYIEQKTLAEIKALTVLARERVPTLIEVLDLIDRRVTVCIELKGMNVAHDVAGIIDQYVHCKGWQQEDFFVVSFNHHQLQKIKIASRSIPTGALISAIPITLGLYAQQAGADVAVLDADCINQQIVDDVHNRGMLVYVFTVNDGDDIAHMIAYGVDGIISDYPDRLCQPSACS